MSNRITQVCIVVLMVCAIVTVANRIKLTNIKCISYNLSLLKFRECDLKVVRRNVVAVNVYAENYSKDIMNLTLNIQFLKKSNSSHPFLYNLTFDCCKLGTLMKSNIFMKLVTTVVHMPMDVFHNCPINNDIYFKNMVAGEDFLDTLPLPIGDYLVAIKIWTYDELLVVVNAYATISEKNIRN